MNDSLSDAPLTGYNESARRRVLDLVSIERERQQCLKSEGRFSATAADDVPNAIKFAMLGEEFGEVAKQVLTQPEDPTAFDTTGSSYELRKELIQTAAVAVAWAEALL